MNYSLLAQLLKFEEDTLKPIMAKGYSREDATFVVFSELNEQLAH